MRTTKRFVLVAAGIGAAGALAVGGAALADETAPDAELVIVDEVATGDGTDCPGESGEPGAGQL